MIKWILFACLVVTFKFLFSGGNPYTLNFIFGKKGSGKTLYMVKLMLKHLRKGWIVYSDFPVNIPGVRVINIKDLESFRPEPHSVLFLDEVGITFDNRKFKSFSDGMRDFFKFSRKMECKIYVNSQSYDIDKKIRDVVDNMVLMVNVGRVSVIRPIRRSITLTEPSAEGESRIADRLTFKSIFSFRFLLLKKYYKYFNTNAMPGRDLIPFEEVINCDYEV